MTTPWLASFIALTVVATALPAQQPDSAPHPPAPAPGPPPPPPPPPPPKPRPPKSSSSLITTEDIERVRSSAANGYEIVQMLRPQWLRTPRNMLNLPGATAGDTGPEFSVFVDDHEMGGLNYLKSVPADQIYTLRFMTMSEVGARYGPTNGPGIVVTFKEH